ncbi:MAG: hypothetical protein ACHQ53_09265 [Polyangiales bacterium]
MDKQTLWMGTLLLVVASLGCGSSNKPSGMEDAGDSGLEDSGKPDSGKPDSGPSMTMTMTAMPVPCGSNMCQPPGGAGGGLLGMLGGLGGAAGGMAGGAAGGLGLPMAAACCLDETSGTCGISAGAGMMCQKMAVPDSRCPGPDLGALGALVGGGMAMSGCCTDSNQCGVDGAAFGNGCVEDGAAASMLSAIPLIGMLIMIPPPRACDASGGGNDAGSEMMMMSGGDAGH